MKKILNLLLAFCLIISLSACTGANAETEGQVNPKKTSDDNCAVLDIDAVNKWLNESADLGEGSKANVVAVIPITHINGPREIDQFYAFVNYKYKARSYIKYQVTYISCTCRSADVNYWQTAYVELTLPSSKNIEDSQIKFLSFDRDSQDHYTAGFWGDSDPTPAGHTYEEIKEQYVSYFFDKDYKYIKSLNVVEDIKPEDYSAGEGRENYSVDYFTGSSVSTNNIILMLQAIFEHHGTDDFFN